MFTNKPTRYHPLQITFHWLVLILLLALFLVGKYMSGLPNNTGKLLPLGIHMTLGLVTLMVLIARLVARSRLPQPVPADTGHPLLNRIGKVVHYALYVFVFLMVISGLSLSIQTDLFPIVFGSSGAALPADFLAYNARILHGLVARGLVVLVGLHVGAALYHEIWVKDKLMARMWFGKKHVVENEMQRERV